jgi:hypothetical protein
MDEKLSRNLIYGLGIIAALYIAARYILPLIFRLFSALLGILSIIIVAALIVIGVMWVIGYVSKNTQQK